MQTKNIRDIYYKGNIYIGCELDNPTYISVETLEKYLSAITHYPYIGEEKLLDGVEVVEGVDYRILYEWKSKLTHGWNVVTHAHWTTICAPNTEKRIVAYGIPKAKGDGTEYCDKCDLFTSKTPNGYCNECGNFIGQLIPLSEKTEKKETQEDMWGIVENQLEFQTEIFAKDYIPIIELLKEHYLITRK